MDGNIDLKKFFEIMKRRKLTLIGSFLIVSIFTLFISIFVIKPSYEATDYLLVGSLGNIEERAGTNQDINKLLASTIDFIKSPIVLSTVSNELNVNMGSLEEKITVRNNDNSQIINVVVRDSSPEQAKELTQAIAFTTVEKMNELLYVDNIEVLSYQNGSISTKQIGSTTVNIAIGIMVGLFLGIGLAMLKEYFDDSVKNSREVEEIFGLTVLGYLNLDEKIKPMKKKKRKPIKKNYLHRVKGGELGA
ncbi:Wzz/FepE/Etk N-terminal domain-containing protein [Evansella sp. AB-P1]|uniref:YveK family protein n=1 Tax=Evansella sp. AB-P1 TaxID=3037653 RepID=UPI00241DEE2B|nr:Wzz/FepE/Etk N-terminal domain-containing protein [Evansella sp. AB-P1]MDG5787892.1 Wzz/FepE/Etk N-terminal domain-containing protein [Evansella sp. AB-P1]